MVSKYLTLTICMVLFSLTFITAQEMLSGEITKEQTQCIDSFGKIVKCESVPTKDAGKYTELPETSKLIIKEDGMYLDNLKLKDERDASVYIHKKVGTTYHVDNLNKEKVSAYLDFYYDIQPDYITHIDKNKNLVNTYFPTEWTWMPNCSGSGEEVICSGGTVRVYVTDLTEESIGSETFPIGTTGPTWASDGKFAGEFNGRDSNVLIGNTPSVNLTTNLSISIWFRVNDTDVIQRFISKYGSGGGYFCYSRYRDVSCGIFNTTGQENSIKSTLDIINDNTWNHALFLKSNNTQEIYINGILAINGSFSDNIINHTTANLRLGSISGGTSNMNGSLDNIQIFNTTLTQENITALYNNGRINSPCNLLETDNEVLCIDFDDYSVADKSGNGNHGVPTNLTFTPIQLTYKTLIENTDYTLDKSTGLFTIINDNLVYNWVMGSWEYYETANDQNATMGQLVLIFTALGILSFILLIINYYRKQIGG